MKTVLTFNVSTSAVRMLDGSWLPKLTTEFEGDERIYVFQDPHPDEQGALQEAHELALYEIKRFRQTWESFKAEQEKRSR